MRDENRETERDRERVGNKQKGGLTIETVGLK